MALYIFSDCPSTSPPALPSPASYVCACVRVCSNFSSLIMALAVANITQPHSSSRGTNSSSNKRSQRPLRFTPLSTRLCHHPRAPCCCCCWDVSRTLRCCQLMWACTAATSASPSFVCPFPAFPTCLLASSTLLLLLCYCWLFHALSVRFYAHFMFVFLAQGYC